MLRAAGVVLFLSLITANVTSLEVSKLAEDDTLSGNVSNETLELFSDSAIYDVRQYRVKNSTWEYYSRYGSPFFAWMAKLSTSVLMKRLDVVYVHMKIPGTNVTVSSGRKYPYGLQLDHYEKEYPGEVVYFTWVVRFDNLTHAESVWVDLFGNREFLELFAEHPFFSTEVVRAESRFMKAIVHEPKRNHERSKIYETINYTVDTKLRPWNEETRNQFIEWINRNTIQGNLVSAFVALVPPVTILHNTTDFSSSYNGLHFTSPQIVLTWEWENISQADKFWALIKTNPGPSGTVLPNKSTSDERNMHGNIFLEAIHLDRALSKIEGFFFQSPM